ncbi:hypothetical protein [Crossiella sp. CA198]|uniref:hypothetical protein n=1 Tax=Crossiella sp. CA198 TaxID=3455607 RepID=UPI003F8D487A
MNERPQAEGTSATSNPVTGCTTRHVLNPAEIAATLVELLTTGQHFHAATPAVLAAVGAERVRQRAKHGVHAPDSPSMNNHERLVVLVEEVGEIARAMSHDGTLAGLCSELTQVAAVVLAWLDALAEDPAEQEDWEEPPF